MSTVQELTRYCVRWTDHVGTLHNTDLYAECAEDACNLIKDFYNDSVIKSVVG